MISHPDLLALLDYNPNTGVFRWKASRGPLAAGSVAGHTGRDGNVSIMVEGKSILAHRLAWFYVTGEWPDRHVSHIDGDISDNRFANLRLATGTEIRANSRKSKANTSGYKGVSRVTGSDKWAAYISIDGRRKNLGHFARPEIAAAAYEQAARQAYGEFARPE